MSAANAKEAAESWISRAHLPADLRGREVQLVIFANDDDCRFFYPRRALEWQQKVNTYIARDVRSRKGKVWRVELTPAKYHEWRGARADSENLRREFADGHHRLLGQSETHGA